ncbi:MAG: hypothetical protein M3Y64_05155, partial [Gemmatimonadota bacterium]|nr:hypothetical protein [Gemmatimonadota bacterium]
LSVPFPGASAVADSATQQAMSLAIWALQRWGVADVVLEVKAYNKDSVATLVNQRRTAILVSWLSSVKVRASPSVSSARGVAPNEVQINVFSLSPSEIRARSTTLVRPQ